MELLKYNTNDYRPTTFRSFVENFFKDEHFSGGSVPSFKPQVDVAETEKEFEIQLLIPGIKKNEVIIDINEDQLVISGDRKLDKENKDKNYHSIESYYGSFRRSFHLPDVVNRDKISASYNDGVLTVNLPKDEKKVTKKQITIK